MKTHEDKNIKTGLVLGGGGAKGCYEVGAWQAFEECGIKFDCVCGTSIGAIIGAIYTQQTIEPILDFVYTISPGNVVKDYFDFPDDFNDIVQNKENIRVFLERFIKEKANDISPLIDSLEKIFDYERFQASPVNYACMTYNVTKMQGQPFFKQDIDKENAIKIIIASASCFPAFPMMEINDEKFIDGGYADNVPVDLMRQMNVDKMVVVDVHGPGRYLNYEKSEDILYIEPILPLCNFLDFRTEQGARSLRIGYLETMKYLSKFCGYVYTFPRRFWPDIYVFEQYAFLYMEQKHINITHDFAYKCISSVLGYKPKVLENKYMSDYTYGILLEALALCTGLDVINLYNWHDFIRNLCTNLKKLRSLRKPENIKEAFEMFKHAQKEEIIVFFHDLMKENKGHLPFVYEPLKTVFDVSYTLAVLWLCLEKYIINKKA